jgi:hypothetical protein
MVSVSAFWFRLYFVVFVHVVNAIFLQYDYGLITISNIKMFHETVILI